MPVVRGRPKPTGATLPAPNLVQEALRSPGKPLDAGTCALMEARFDAEFGPIRVHRNEKAVQSAEAVNALAYTVGRHLVFGRGQFAPGTPRGRRVLAHELTHTLQQCTSSGPVVVQRLPPPGVRLSVGRPALERLERKIGRAIRQLRRLADERTFVFWSVPILSRLADRIGYRDDAGGMHGGQAVEISFPGRRRPFRLRLTLDDRASPATDGAFGVGPGPNAGQIELFLRRGLLDATDSDLASLLYHETIHLFSYWFREIGAAHLPSRPAGQRARIDLTLYRDDMALIRPHIETILGDVNRRRAASDTVPPSRAADFARVLVEEAMVRGETMFMELAAMRRRAIHAARATGSPAIPGLSESGAMQRGQGAASYLFETDMLRRSDRRSMGESAQRAFQRISIILGGVTYEHVQFRWGGTGSSTIFQPSRIPSL